MSEVVSTETGPASGSHDLGATRRRWLNSDQEGGGSEECVFFLVNILLLLAETPRLKVLFLLDSPSFLPFSAPGEVTAARPPVTQLTLYIESSTRFLVSQQPSVRHQQINLLFN